VEAVVCDSASGAGDCGVAAVSAGVKASTATAKRRFTIRAPKMNSPAQGIQSYGEGQVVGKIYDRVKLFPK
jgi:hypothetical protein